MPAFGIGTNVIRRDNGNVRGNAYPIACMAWYAPGQAPVPLLLKFEGHDGVIQAVGDIKAINIDSKCYDGTNAYEYRCEAVIGGIKHGFKLIFYIADCRWIMLL